MPHVGISEHTDRPDFIDFLREKLGVQFKVYQELSALDSRGKRRIQEDIVVFNADRVEVDLQNNTLHWNSDEAVIAVIETKAKGTTNLERVERQLLNYVRFFKCSLGFLTNYRDILCYRFSADFEIQEKRVFRNADLEKLANHIADFIEENSKMSITRSSSEIMKLLEGSVADLMAFTKSTSGDTWERILRLSDASEKDMKKRSLTMKEKSEREIFFQRSAAYIAIAQILFYVTFRQFRIGKNVNVNPKLRPLSSSNGIPTQIQEIIEDIPNNNLNFRAIFGKNREVFSRLDDDASHVLREITGILEGTSSRFVIENDLIGQIFQRLMPYETRKKFAAFYTRPKAAELLCRLAIKSKDAVVYDPACGSGTLLVYAYKMKRELGLHQHKVLLDQIKGSDISDIATMMSTINLAIQDPSKWTNHVNIYPHDAFSLISGLTRYFEHTRESPDGRLGVSPIFPPDEDYRVDVLLANPPFTRGTRIAGRQRKVLTNLELVSKYKFKPNFKSISLYAFFLLIAPQLVNTEDGRIAFILPQGAINSKIMTDVWQILFNEGFGLSYIIEASDQDESFSDSKDQQIMVVLERGYIGFARLVKLFGKLATKNSSKIINEIERAETPFERTEDFLIQLVGQNQIKSTSCMNWETYPSQMMTLVYPRFIPLDRDKLSDKEKSKSSLDLSSVVQIVTENASRPVDYWFVPNKYWEVEKATEEQITLRARSENTVISQDPEARQTLTLPTNAFVPAIARSLKTYGDAPPIIPADRSDNFFLTDENRKGLEGYFNWGKKAHEEGLFGKSHSKYTPTKNAGGLLTKIDFYGGKTLALRFSRPMAGARLITVGFFGKEEIYSDLFFAYLTSSLFLLDAMEKSRTRRAEFARINMIDFYQKHRFPNLERIVRNEGIADAIISASERHNGTISLNDRPRIPEMIRIARTDRKSTLRELDEAWFRALELPLNYLDTLYREIEERIKDIVLAREG